MNENPEGTPNPLNPAAAAPAEPVAPVEPVAPATPAAPAEPEQPGSIVEPAKKKSGKKIGLIIGIIVGILAIGGGTAAALMLTVFKPADAVPKAIEKLLSGDTNKYLSVEGNIIGTPSGTASSIVSSVNINFKAQLDMVAPANSVSATIAASIGDETDISFNVDEVQVADGDMYLKLDGVSDALGEYSSMIPGLSTIELIEGDWLRVSKSDFSQSEGMGILDNSSQCLINAITNAPSYSNSLAEIYKQNQFVTYSTDNIKVDKKKNTIYRLGYNSDKLASFINAMSNSGFANDLLACTGGTATKQDVTASDVENIFSNFPTTYVEIDGNYNITRAYFDASDAGFTANLSIEYPSNVNIVEPNEYKNLSDYLSEILDNIYSGGLYNFNFNIEDYGFDIEDYDYDYDYDFDFDFDSLE
ncbi:hypothetical protein IKD57_01025 [Candidatus Saccharibacteria bacterium]|nr:hypothetical protein [Candidatus Saccharibacteria bacterium]